MIVVGIEGVPILRLWEHMPEEDLRGPLLELAPAEEKQTQTLME